MRPLLLQQIAMNKLGPDELSALCSQMTSAAQICKLSSTCRAMNNFFKSTASKNAWQIFVKNVCGYEAVEGRQPLPYRAMITICPYLATPEIHRVNVNLFEGFNAASRFEMASSKKDGSVYLWCENGSQSDHVQFSGKSKRVVAEDLVFSAKPRMSDIGAEQVAAWAQIHPESQMSTTFFSFHHNPGHKIMQIHNSLFVACVISREAGHAPHNARGKRVLVFFTKTGGGSIRVLYTIRAYTEKVTGPNQEDHITSFVAFDRARLCIRKNLQIMKYYGPSTMVESWKPDPSVALRRLLAGEPSSFQLANLKQCSDLNEHLTEWPIMRCVLEARNYEVSRKLMDQAKEIFDGFHESIRLLYTEDSGRSMLFTAVKTGNTDTVRFIIESGVNVNTSYREKGYDIISYCMINPDMAAIIFEHVKIEELDWALAYNLSHAGQTADIPCEPIIHILKNQTERSAALKDNTFRDDYIKTIIEKYVDINDPGLLVLKARFLRTLILEGEPLSEEKQHIFLAFAMRKNHLYMATFLASMGMRLMDHGDWCMLFLPEPNRTEMEEALARIYQSV